MPTKPAVAKPRLRSSDGSFAARGTINGKILRKVWTSPATRAAAPAPSTAFSAPVQPVEFYSNFVADKVDSINGIIRGVSVMTSGLIARGHDLEVDSTTLEQVKTCAESKTQVPVKINHKSGAEAVCGFLTNFHLDGSKLKADWHLLKTHPQKDTILEVAERMPGGVGLSASFLPPAKAEKAKSGKTAARCSELLSVDYVTLPAANPDGMFGAKVDSPNPAMNPETLAALQKILSEALAPITTKLEALEAQQNLLANPPELAELNEMSDAELEKLGLTRAEVDEAIEAHNAEIEAGEGEGDELEPTAEEGTGEGEGEEAAPAGAPAAAASATGLNALLAEVRQFSAELKRAKAQKADAEQALELQAIETKFDAVLEELSARDEQIAQLQAQLKTGGKPASHGAGGNVQFKAKSGTVVQFGTKELGAFEEAVIAEVQAGKTRSLAFQSVIKSDPESYRDYRVRCGGIKA